MASNYLVILNLRIEAERFFMSESHWLGRAQSGKRNHNGSSHMGNGEFPKDEGTSGSLRLRLSHILGGVNGYPSRAPYKKPLVAGHHWRLAYVSSLKPLAGC